QEGILKLQMSALLRGCEFPRAAPRWSVAFVSPRRGADAPPVRGANDHISAPFSHVLTNSSAHSGAYHLAGVGNIAFYLRPSHLTFPLLWTGPARWGRSESAEGVEAYRGARPARG